MQALSQRKNVYCAIFSLLFAFLNCYIYMDDRELFQDKWDKPILFFNTVVVTAVCFLFLRNLIFSDSRIAKATQTKSKAVRGCSDKKYFLLTAAVIFLLWVPVFLAYYPGLFAYDAHVQVGQIGAWSMHHPLLHTLYLQFFYYIIGGLVFEDYNWALAAATIVQMVIFACMLSIIHVYMRKILKGGSNGV